MSTPSQTVRPGDLLAGRYLLVDLLSESASGRFYRAHDRILERHVAVHVIPTDDPRSERLLEAARRSADVTDRRLLRVLDAVRGPEICYVVNEWGPGTSLDFVVATSGPLPARTAAWLVGEVADTIAVAHARGVAHGRLIPEAVLVDNAGEVRLIGCCVDAALHGLTQDRVADDVTDLGGMLHFALTGRWAGVSESVQTRAPVSHGRVLRPRQVRAGVPRPLDDLCDDILGPGVLKARHSREHPAPTARGIADALRDFVGDASGIGEKLAERLNDTHPGRQETVVLPAVPDLPLRETDPTPLPPVIAEPVEPAAPHATPADAATDAATDAGPAEAAEAEPPQAVDVPTEVGMPVFGDDQDDVSWFTPRPGPVKPPPPFEAPPARPLFAPEPDDGGPVRRLRPGGAAESPEPAPHGDFWPWDSERPALPLPVEDDAPPAEVPGRSFLRLAAAVAAGVLVLLVIVVAYNLGRGRTVLGTTKDPGPTPSPTVSTSAPPTTAPPLTELTGLTATSFDPESDDGLENPDLAPLAVDGDPSTSWHTSTYKAQLGDGPLALKSGVGLVIDLGASSSVSEIDLTLVGAGTGVSSYLTDTPPTTVDALTPVDRRTAGPDTQIALAAPATGRYLTLWLTALPTTDDGFQGGIAEVRVLA